MSNISNRTEIAKRRAWEYHIWNTYASESAKKKYLEYCEWHVNSSLSWKQNLALAKGRRKWDTGSLQLAVHKLEKHGLNNEAYRLRTAIAEIINTADIGYLYLRALFDSISNKFPYEPNKLDS